MGAQKESWKHIKRSNDEENRIGTWVKNENRADNEKVVEEREIMEQSKL